MTFINGLLGLGTSVVSGVITEPGSGLGYARQPISFSTITGGVTLNVVNGTFGAVSGSWGTLSVFQLFDTSGNPAWVGTLASPVTPVPGQLVYVPVGTLSVYVNSQLPASGAASGLQSAISLPSSTIAGNASSGTAGPQTIYPTSGIGMASGVSGVGYIFQTPSTSGMLGGVMIPSGGYLAVDASGNLSVTSQPFTVSGGTVSGSVTVLGNLAVTGNSTVSGSSTVSGASRAASIYSSGAANVAGTLSVTGLATLTKLSVYNPAGTTWSGSGGAGVSNLYVVGNVSGTLTTGILAVNHFSIPSDNVDSSGAPGGDLVGLQLAHNIGSGTKGNRFGFLVLLNNSGGQTPGSGSYIAGSFQAAAGFNNGGSGVSGNAAGHLFGLYPQAILNTGATNWSYLVGQETDIGVASGASSQSVVGVKVTTLSMHATPGALADAFFQCNAQAGAAGMRFGYVMGDPSAGLGLDAATGVILGAYTQTAVGGGNRAGSIPAPATFAGADFANLTFALASGFAFRSSNFSVDGFGQIRTNSLLISSGATGPLIDATGYYVSNAVVSSPGNSTGIVSNGVVLNNYYPQNDIILGPANGQYQVLTTKMIAATIVSGGTGGTNGAQVVSGTTGTGTRFVAAVTISGGAITAVNGLNVSGSYSVNPNNPASEPVSGAGLSGAILALGIGVNTVGILVPDWSANGTGTYSNPQVTRYGSGAGCSLNFTWSDASLLQINPSGGNVTIGPANTVSGANNMAFGENNTVATTGGYGMAFGNNNMVSGLAGMAFGTGNVASGVGGAVHGNGASDRGRYGVFAFTTSYKTVPGDAQEATQLLRGSSSATGAIRLTADGGAANSGNTVNLPSNTAYAVSLTLIGIDLTASGNASMVYQAQGLLYQASGVATTTYASGTIGTVLNKGTGLAAPPTLTADTANGGLNVSLTPPNAHTWDWVARVTTVEVQ